MILKHLKIFNIKYFIIICILILSCTSRRHLIVKNNDYLLTTDIDTIEVTANELEIRDTTIYPMLDSLVRKTKAFKAFDPRILPIYLIQINKESSGSLQLNFISSSNYASYQTENIMKIMPVKADEIGSKYGIFIYKGTKFLVWNIFKNTVDSSVLATYYKLFHKKDSIISINFFKFNRMINGKQSEIDDYPSWVYYATYKIRDEKYIFIRQNYVDEIIFR